MTNGTGSCMCAEAWLAVFKNFLMFLSLCVFACLLWILWLRSIGASDPTRDGTLREPSGCP
ncbi:MAG: hypothetical protein J6A23_07290 [Thermoguttaceae bacterium]|nr:hypothetical protein [Thermoguttaceae bacterium]